MNAILLMRLEDMAYHMSLEESSYKENGATVILGIVHLLGQVAVIYALIDAANGTVTMILNLNIVLMRYVRVTVNVNVMSLIQTLSQNAFATKNTPAISASFFITIRDEWTRAFEVCSYPSPYSRFLDMPVSEVMTLSKSMSESEVSTNLLSESDMDSDTNSSPKSCPCPFISDNDNENFDGDFDGDQKMDTLDLDDDNDGIPDVFEFKYEGSYKGPWKPGEDKRAALCPRIKLNFECGENFNFQFEFENFIRTNVVEYRSY